jgi:hypothetical protein
MFEAIVLLQSSLNWGARENFREANEKICATAIAVSLRRPAEYSR